MLKISEFSRLGRVTVKALHLYDQLGLLTPARVDVATGYRFYTLDQLPRLNRILALKDLGFSLGEIARLLDEHPSSADLRDLLRRKQADLTRAVAERQARLARVDARLRLIEQEDMPKAYDIVLKPIGAMRVAAARGRAPTIESMVRRTYEIVGLVKQSRVAVAGPEFTLFYHEGFRERDLDFEVVVPVAAAASVALTTPDGWRVRMRELPGVAQAACLVYRGSDGLLIESYASIGAWVAANGYQVAGPIREIYLRDGNPNDKVFEIQFPIEEA